MADSRGDAAPTTPTPVERAPAEIAGGREIFWKREDLHELGSFKWRGALPALERFRAEGASGVVTASTGNHGAATAWAARRLGLRAAVWAPIGASLDKLRRIESLGGEIHLAGKDLDEAKEEGRKDAAARGLPFFEDGAEPAQHVGYGRIASEIFQEFEGQVGSIVVPVGNGALITGIGKAARKRTPPAHVTGAIARSAPVMALSFESGGAVACEEMATFADGLAVRVAIPQAVEWMIGCVDSVSLVSEREIATAVGLLARSGIRAEGAAGAGLAAALGRPDLPEPVVVILTGRNIDEGLYRRAVEDPESFPS